MNAPIVTVALLIHFPIEGSVALLQFLQHCWKDIPTLFCCCLLCRSIVKWIMWASLITGRRFGGSMVWLGGTASIPDQHIWPSVSVDLTHDPESRPGSRVTHISVLPSGQSPNKTIIVSLSDSIGVQKPNRCFNHTLDLVLVFGVGLEHLTLSFHRQLSNNLWISTRICSSQQRLLQSMLIW